MDKTVQVQLLGKSQFVVIRLAVAAVVWSFTDFESDVWYCHVENIDKDGKKVKAIVRSLNETEARLFDNR